MSITLNLPEDLASELSAEAEQLGLPLADYALRVLATGRAIAKAPTSGGELVAYWQNEGIIGDRPDIADSQQHAREIRQHAERRTQG